MSERYGTFPCLEYWLVRGFSSTHGGIDIGWQTTQDVPLIAWKSGKIIWSEYTKYGGNVIALEVTNGDTKQWCLYQHCKSTVQLRSVRQGEIIGTMGNTGESKGTHLHFSLIKEVSKDKVFDYNWAINNVIDPLPYLYRRRDIKYNLDKTLNMIKYMDYITPVERDTYKNQISVNTDFLFVREQPSLKAADLGYAPRGYYNSLETKEADGYVWHRVDNVWLAQTSNVEYLPKSKDDEHQQVIELKERVNTLEGMIERIKEIVC